MFTGVSLRIGFCTVNLDWFLVSNFFFDVSDGQFICKINRTSSKFTVFNLSTVERSEDLSNNQPTKEAYSMILGILTWYTWKLGQLSKVSPQFLLESIDAGCLNCTFRQRIPQLYGSVAEEVFSHIRSTKLYLKLLGVPSKAPSRFRKNNYLLVFCTCHSYTCRFHKGL